MRVAGCEGSLSIVSWSSELDASAAVKGMVSLDNDEEYPSGKIFEFSTFSDSGADSASSIYIGMSSEGNVPTILWVDGSSSWLIGFNSSVYRYSSKLELKKKEALSGGFANFKVSRSLDCLFVLSENAVYAYSWKLEKLWSIQLDVITSVSWEEFHVHIEQMDGPQVSVDLRDGSSSIYVRKY